VETRDDLEPGEMYVYIDGARVIRRIAFMEGPLCPSPVHAWDEVPHWDRSGKCHIYKLQEEG
jgi:hypothetical protein